MKKKVLSVGLSALFLSGAGLMAHGPAHRHGPAPAPDHGHHHHHDGHDHHDHEEVARNWGVSLESGWESRHVHYGVDETGREGAYQNELTLWVDRFVFQFWSGFGTGNDFEKYELSLAWQGEVGPLFLVPGYRFRYQPGLVEEGHGHTGGSHTSSHDEDHDDHGHGDHDDHHGEEAGASSGSGHLHKRHGHELFLTLGTRRLPYVVPSLTAVWDVNNTPGAYLEARLDGELPLMGKRLVAEPYALVGVNLGYNTRQSYGWNHFQVGGQLRWNVHERVALYAGAHYSVALEAVRSIGQGNEVWATTGISLHY